MKKTIKILKPDPETVHRISRNHGISGISAAILANRGITCEDDVSAFLNPDLATLKPPFGILDLDVAAARIYSAILGKERILIFGDYDADGVTATTILYEILSELGADIRFYIPHRVNEGYGLSPDHITRFAQQHGVNLIVTVDCGSGSRQAIRLSKEAGIDVVVTDHHEVECQLPEAVAFVNPKRPECSSGFDALAGVGVAFYLMVSLRKIMQADGFFKNRPVINLKKYLDLVAIGTMADVVPLRDFNRVFVKTGVDLIKTGDRPGISALLDVSKIRKEHVTSDDIAFRIAPRLNAAGRMEHANISVDLLLSRQVEEARQLAFALNRLNTNRQENEKEIFETIVSHIDRNRALLKRKTIVLSNPNWHEGILGIIAARLVESFYRPVILFAVKGGMGKGSARSIRGFDLFNGLSKCASHLSSFGGHAMAAGLSIKMENMGRFSDEFEAYAQDSMENADFVPEFNIDYELDFREVNSDLLDELDLLMPFGSHNEEPLFMTRDVKVDYQALVGGRHLRMRLVQQNSGPNIYAIRFNVDPDAPRPDYFERIIYRLRRNRYSGQNSAQIVIEDV